MKDCLISVDVEASGPIPGEYSLLSIGACVVHDLEQTFEVELRPITRKADPKAMAVLGETLEHYDERGLEVELAMTRFKEWIDQVSADQKAVFVGFNAPFDWSFINYYFHRYLSENPFGFAALDIKALYMGRRRVSWSETKSSAISKALGVAATGDHNPLHDALYQARLCRGILEL